MSWPFFWTSAQPEAVTRSKGNKPSSGVVLRRARFCIRALYWSARHRSISHGVWVTNYEGHSW